MSDLEQKMLSHFASLQVPKHSPYNGRIQNGSHYKLLASVYEDKRRAWKREMILLELERRKEERKRKIKEAIERLAQQELENEERDMLEKLTKDATEALMKGLRIPERARMVIAPVLQDHGIFWTEVFSESRSAHIVQPRQDMWLLLKRAGYSLSQIGRMFNRDHSTISQGVGKANERENKRNSRSA